MFAYEFCRMRGSFLYEFIKLFSQPDLSVDPMEQVIVSMKDNNALLARQQTGVPPPESAGFHEGIMI